MAKLIDGRAVAEKVYAGLRGDIAELKAKGVTPGLAVVLVGDDPASRAYVRSKDKMCRELGLHSVKLELPPSTTQSELLARVEELNRDSTIHGILVQSPPPEHIDEVAIVRALDPRKDVDGFHPGNVAKLVLEDASGFVPCTPLGVQRLLLESAIEINGAHVVVIGRSMVASAKRVADFVQGCLREFARQIHRYLSWKRNAGRSPLARHICKPHVEVFCYAALNLFDGDRLPAFFLQNVL